MGASAKHGPGQYTFEHGLLADAKQPLDTPDFFTKYDEPGNKSAGTIQSGDEYPGK
jgi:hypothetical protein